MVSETVAHDAVRRIASNQKLIREVLNYWFGQFSPDQSQKLLWMIASSSVQRREQVDAEITQRFGSLLCELSQKDSTRWSEWCAGECGIYGRDGKIAAIIVMDQMSRHMHRYLKSESVEHGEETIHIPDQKDLDLLALEAAELLMENHKKEIQCGMIPLPMYIFSLMPFRHASTIETVARVQNCIEESASMNEMLDAMLRRFRKATNRRMAVLQDEQRRSNSGKEKPAEPMQGEDSEIESAPEFSDEDILEAFPFDADMKDATKHAITSTMSSFLSNVGLKRAKPGSDHPVITPLIVSLSGGVDSMVIAFVLAQLAKNGFPIYVLAVHIDYANRPESGAEAAYVQKFCENIGITFVCRRIDEVTRGVTARDDYERIARDIRYDAYRDVLAQAKRDLSEKAYGTTPGVFLGHHRGDLRENVLSNAHKGCGPLDLSGMTASSTVGGVTIYRPLLPLEKTFIFDYAHKFGVPYFKDTTPHWSTRGKLRNKLLPLLEEIYGEGSMNNLSTLATESDSCRGLMYDTVLRPFLDQVVKKPMGIYFDTAPWKGQALFFWKFVLREVLHDAGLGMFSDKSVASFLERIRVKDLFSGWLQCRKDYGVYLREDGRVFVLFPASFPWRSSDAYKTDGIVPPYDPQNTTTVGPWRIRAEISSRGPDVDQHVDMLSQKAVASMEHFMEGNIEYYMCAPGYPTEFDGREVMPRPLSFGQFTKASRPIAWKKCDLKIQTSLPLLGNDEIANMDLADIKSGVEESLVIVLVRVELRLGGIGVENSHCTQERA